MGRKPTPPRQRVCRFCGSHFVTQGNGQKLWSCGPVCRESARGKTQVRKALRGKVPVGRVIIRTQDGQRGQVGLDEEGLPCFVPDLES